MTANILALPVKKAAHKKRISVIMVSYMTGPALLEAIMAVLADTDIFEFILVDNGNTEPARQSVADLIASHDKVRLLQGHGNIGFAKGCNYGAKQATGDYFLFLNPDAVLSPGAALKMAVASEGRVRPWVTGGLLRDIHGHEQRGGRRGALTPMSAFVTFTHLYKLPFFRSIHREGEPLPQNPSAIPVVSGACLMMDRISFAAVDGFDEKYFLHVEDIDLCHRVRKAGGEVIFVPGATVMHYGSTSLTRPHDIEWSKLKGFIRYFWYYSPHWYGPVLTVLASPFMAIAILGRSSILALRKAIIGR